MTFFRRGGWSRPKDDEDSSREEYEANSSLYEENSGDIEYEDEGPSLKRFDVFLNPSNLAEIVNEIETAFRSVDLSDFTSDPIGPAISHLPDKHTYFLWGTMTDDTGSRFAVKKLGRLLYDGSGNNLHLKTKNPVDKERSNYRLVELLGEREINTVLQSVVDKYKL